MKRIGVLASGDRWHVGQLASAAAEIGAELIPLSFRDLRARTSDGESEFTCFSSSESGPRNLAELDAIIVRAMPQGTLEQIITRMNILGQLERQHGVLMVNPARTIEIAVDKYLCLETVRACGIAVPVTVATERAEAAMEAFRQLRDVVVKPLFGSRGRGIERLTDAKRAGQRFQELEADGHVICLQQFIDHGDSDMRLLVIGDRVLGMRRHRPGHWLTNLAQGASAAEHQVTDTERRLALSAARGIGASFAGIDLVYDNEGRPFVIEVNASPGWKGLSDVVPPEDAPAQVLIDWVLAQLPKEPDGRRKVVSP